MTHEQSLALVDAMVSSPKVKAHLGCALGFKKVPSAPDFGPDTRNYTPGAKHHE